MSKTLKRGHPGALTEGVQAGTVGSVPGRRGWAAEAGHGGRPGYPGTPSERGASGGPGAGR